MCSDEVDSRAPRAYTASTAATPAAWRHEPHSDTKVRPSGVRLMPFCVRR